MRLLAAGLLVNVAWLVARACQAISHAMVRLAAFADHLAGDA